MEFMGSVREQVSVNMSTTLDDTIHVSGITYGELTRWKEVIEGHSAFWGEYLQETARLWGQVRHRRATAPRQRPAACCSPLDHARPPHRSMQPSSTPGSRSPHRGRPPPGWLVTGATWPSRRTGPTTANQRALAEGLGASGPAVPCDTHPQPVPGPCVACCGRSSVAHRPPLLALSFGFQIMCDSDVIFTMGGGLGAGAGGRVETNGNGGAGGGAGFQIPSGLGASSDAVNIGGGGGGCLLPPWNQSFHGSADTDAHGSFALAQRQAIQLVQTSLRPTPYAYALLT